MFVSKTFGWLGCSQLSGLNPYVTISKRSSLTTLYKSIPFLGHFLFNIQYSSLQSTYQQLRKRLFNCIESVYSTEYIVLGGLICLGHQTFQHLEDFLSHTTSQKI